MVTVSGSAYLFHLAILAVSKHKKEIKGVSWVEQETDGEEEKEKKGQEGTGNKRDNERCMVSIITLACLFNNSCYFSSYIK